MFLVGANWWTELWGAKGQHCSSAEFWMFGRAKQNRKETTGTIPEMSQMQTPCLVIGWWFFFFFWWFFYARFLCCRISDQRMKEFQPHVRQTAFFFSFRFVEQCATKRQTNQKHCFKSIFKKYGGYFCSYSDFASGILAVKELLLNERLFPSPRTWTKCTLLFRVQHLRPDNLYRRKTQKPKWNQIYLYLSYFLSSRPPEAVLPSFSIVFISQAAWPLTQTLRKSAFMGNFTC